MSNILTAGAPLTRPAPAVTARTTVHVDIGHVISGDLLRCDHPDGKVSFRLVDSNTQLWLTGTVDQFDLFADVIDGFAARIRTEEPT